MDKRYFGTDGIRGRVGEPPITADFVLKLGWAAGQVLGGRSGSGQVLIGKDTRLSNYMFESALEAGLSSAGLDIRLLGPMPTPAIAYLTRTLRANGGIVISASHNSHHDNGIKFFSADGFKLDDEAELAIEANIEKPLSTVDSSSLGKASRLVDAPGRYIEFCKHSLPAGTSLQGLTLVVDCANGAGYQVAPAVFEELGARVIRRGNQPDGLNINVDCGSTHPEGLQQAVLEHQADAGIALDGDGDRVIMVDHQGEILDGDQLLWIIAQQRHLAGSLQGPVVGTQMSNLGLELALGDCGWISCGRVSVTAMSLRCCRPTAASSVVSPPGISSAWIEQPLAMALSRRCRCSEPRHRQDGHWQSLPVVWISCRSTWSTSPLIGAVTPWPTSV